MEPRKMTLPPIRTAIAACLIAGFVTSVQAADWSDSVFPVKNHDFGTCAVAAKTEFRFPVTNTFGNDIHIASVRASCGCTTTTVETPHISPGQTGTIHARFNTDTFRGKKGATLTVVMDKPFYSEVRLRVDGYIRSDMVFHPGSVEFGAVSQGEKTSKSSKIYYAGRDDWKVTDVRSNQPWLTPTIKEVSRGGGRAEYELMVALREDAPEGYFQNEIIVTTNDRAMPKVPLKVAGIVEAPFKISPQAIALGRLKTGESVKKMLVLRGKQPFTIGSIKAAGWEVTYPESNVAKTTHVVNASFTPTEASGDQLIPVEITTSGANSKTAKAVLSAEIRDR